MKTQEGCRRRLRYPDTCGKPVVAAGYCRECCDEQLKSLQENNAALARLIKMNDEEIRKLKTS